MIKSIPLLISFLTVITASTRIFAQEGEKLNKSELREKVAQQSKDIDSLKAIIISKFSEISDKNNQINILKREIQTKDAELKTLSQKNKVGDLQINKYRYSIDSLQNLLNELTIQLTSQQNASAESTISLDGINLQIPGLTETIQPIGWSKDGKFAFRRDLCNGGCGCCSSELVVFDVVNNKYLKTISEDNIQYVDNPSIVFDNHLKHIQSIISTYRIVPTFSGRFTHYERENASHLFLSMEGATIDPDDYINGKPETEPKRIEYTYTAYENSTGIDERLILTINPESYSIAKESASHIPIESGTLKPADMSIPIPAETVGICGYLSSPWNE